MHKDFVHQLDFFKSSALEAPLSPGPGPRATETQCARKFLEFCLGKRGSHKTYVHALFSEILPRHEGSHETADIITHHLLGFPPEEAHAFDQKPHSTLGALWEALVTIIYQTAFPGQLSKDWTMHLEKLDGDLKPRTGDKVTAEWHIWKLALEIKYRSGSYENTRKQALTAKYLRGMGLDPLMLCLRPSPNTAEFRRNGWTVLEGEDALNRIRSDTGVDPEAVLRIVGEHARIKDLRATGRTEMYARLSAICSGHYARSRAHLAPAIHGRIASDPEALLDVLRRALDAGTLEDAVEGVYAAAAANNRNRANLENYREVMEAGRSLLDPQRTP